MPRVAATVVAIALFSAVAACGGDDRVDTSADATTSSTARPTTTTSEPATTTSAATTTTSATTATPAARPSGSAPATTPGAPGTTAAPAPPPAPSTPPPTVHTDGAYRATISWIDAGTRARMTSSWRPGCPVGLGDLRLMTLTYWGFDGAPHTGELVVHRNVASPLAAVMNTLFQARYPIQRMQLVDAYGGSDDASMAANNTSAFNCRATTGGSSWSQHSYGLAIDINPVQNPYVSSGGAVAPPNGAPYVDRSRHDPGMIHAGDVVVQSFAAIGWGWGGFYNSIKDWQHFSSTGR